MRVANLTQWLRSTFKTLQITVCEQKNALLLVLTFRGATARRAVSMSPLFKELEYYHFALPSSQVWGPGRYHKALTNALYGWHVRFGLNESKRRVVVIGNDGVFTQNLEVRSRGRSSSLTWAERAAGCWKPGTVSRWDSRTASRLCFHRTRIV